MATYVSELFYTGAFDGSYAVGPTNLIRQGLYFTTVSEFDLAKIGGTAFYKDSGTTGTLTMDVFETSGGLPVGSPIGTSTINVSVIDTLPLGAQLGNVEFVLDSPVTLSATTEYAVVFTGNISGGNVLLRAIGDNNVGVARISTSDGINYGLDSGHEFILEFFSEEFVAPEPEPEEPTVPEPVDKQAKDIALTIENFLYDARIATGDFQNDGGLETLVIISLFTDKRVTTEQLPDFTSDKKGWWGDMVPLIDQDQIGSRLWTLKRSKVTNETLKLHEDYALESLQWMIEDGIAESIEADANYNSELHLILDIKITRPDNTETRFNVLWDNQSTRILNKRVTNGF